MKLEPRDNTQIRTVLHGMISDKTVLAALASKWKPRGLFNSPSGNILAKLCVDHYNNYQKPPDYSSLEGILESWAEGKSQESIDNVGRLINDLTDEHESNGKLLNPKYVLNIAKKLINVCEVDRLIERSKGHKDNGKIDEAIQEIENFRRVEIGGGAGSNLFVEREAIARIFSRQRFDPLIKYPDGLGEFFGSSLRRGGFISVLAPEKTGKTSWLVDMSYQAMLSRAKVAFFSIGDEDEDDINERMAVRCCQHPITNENGFPAKVQWPISIKKPDRGKDKAFKEAIVEREILTFDKPLAELAMAEKLQRVQAKKVKSKESYFRVSAYPSLGIDVPGIVAKIREWELDNWLPDVVVIDYPDNLASISGYKEKINQVANTWQKLRAMAQAPYHFLVLVATQTNTDGYSKILLDRRNFSESKTKLAHVTGMFGLNVYGKEKGLGITRLNWIVRRKGDYTSRRVCHVAGCLALANPAVCSVM